MKHVGDITKIHGYELESVDCICGGSPCQDLSVAGKRAGLDGARSGLFMEQIRIVKEMRYPERYTGSDQLVRPVRHSDRKPRYMVWENVPGAFSSGSPKGADFAAVIEEIIKIECEKFPTVQVPDGGWPVNGCFYDELGRWSIAWTVHDAQKWCVPQRRKRISLVADFGGMSAPEILFERKSLSGDSEQSGTERKEASGNPEKCTENANYTLKIRGGCDGGGKGPLIQKEKIGTLSTLQDQTLFQVYDMTHADEVIRECGEIVPTLQSRMGTGGNQIPIVFSFNSLSSNSMKSKNPHSGCRETECAKTLDCFDPNPAKNQGGIAIVKPVYCLQGNGIDRAETAGCNGKGWKEDICYTLNTIDRPAVVQPYCIGNGQTESLGLHEKAQTLNCMHDQQIVIEKKIRWIVRRLTPLECERLQGYPDGWTNIGEWTDSKGKKHKDSDGARYKALGNSIATGKNSYWKFIMKRISAQYDYEPKLGSLFDGIGGFPLVWEQINGKGSARWASEIEEFCIAVTKKHFPEEICLNS